MGARPEIAIAALCAVWAAAFLAGEGTVVLVAPVFGVAVLPFRRRPVVAVLGVAVASAATSALDVPGENPASLAAGLTVAFGLGRHAGVRSGSAALVVLSLALTVADLVVVDLAFVLFVLTATWACGRLVRRRTAAAARAVEAAAALAAQDPRAAAARVVAAERARLAGDALAVVRAAVEGMHRDAVVAESDLDPCSLAAVQAGGRAGVAELRRLLGLLRAEPASAAPASGSRTSWHRDPRRRGHALAISALLLALAVDVVAWAAGGMPGSIWLTLAFAAASLIAWIDAGAACLLAALPFAVGAGFDVQPAAGFSSVVAAGALAWWSGADGRPRTLMALAAMIAVTLLAVHADSPGNEGIMLGIYALGCVAGATWGRRGREGGAATAVAGRLRAEHEAVTEQARQAERLRLARELHDVASHAVGAMVLQAGAALALRERDPDAARAAVRAVQTSGAEALEELSVLFGLLDAGAVGPAGLAAADPAREGDGALSAVQALADRMRGGGIEIVVNASVPLPDDPLVLATAYRIVQESLTNAARHAPGSRVAVALTVDGDSLVVTVRDDGAKLAREGAQAQGGGFGLVGLAERVRGLGGEVSAGPAPGGGFSVTARLPAAGRSLGAPA